MNPPPSAQLLGLGAAAPAGAFTMTETVELALSMAPADNPRAVRALYARSGVERKGSVLLDPDTSPASLYPPGDDAPTTGERLVRYLPAATPLALAAARTALDRAGIAPARITHLVTASCTGFEAPGIDQALVHGLGLAPTVRRTHVGFMGCHAAINALAVAADAVGADPAALALVCTVEICSLHLHCSPRADQHVANALFADGAAAAVMGAPGRGAGADLPGLARFGSILLPDSQEYMRWTIGDHGFEMTLDPRVPDLLARHVPAWVDGLLSGLGLTRRDVGSWAIHPGGPRVVRRLVEALGLPGDAGADSLAVLRERGNMSSPTLLFILERLAARRAPRPWVALAFGPGLAGEAAVLA